MNTRLVGALGAAVLVACGQPKSVPPAASSAMSGMSMRADSLMPVMRAHLDSLSAAPTVASALATHDALTSRLLDAMGSDMTAMGMKPDAAWTALSDSVKRDLADLPALTGSTRDARLKGHVDRLRRLMAMHQSMMGRR